MSSRLPAFRVGLRGRVALGLSALALLFFAPALLAGRVLAPPGDGILYYYPMRVHVAQVLRTGQLPLWNPYIFSGFPLMADIEAGAFYPPNVLFLILPGPWAMNLVAVSSFVLAAFFTWLYARTIGAGVFGALVSGIAFGASGFMASHLGHASIVNAAAWLPLLMVFAERLRLQVRARDVAGAAAALAAQVFAGHPQVAAYSLLTAGLYVLFFAVAGPPAGRARYALGAGAALAGGLLLAACQIVPTAELAAQSNRAWISYEAFSEPALPPSHLLLFLMPYAFGGGSAGPYVFAPMGLSVAECTGYVGLVPLSLALCAFPLARRSPHARFWLILGALALVMALGPHTPLHRLLYHLPGYNLFRAPARNLLQVDLALAVLAGMATSHVTSLGRVVRRVSLVLAAMVAALALLILRMGAALPTALDPRAPLSLAPAAVLARPELAAVGPILAALASALALHAWSRKDNVRTRRLVIAVLLADLGAAGQVTYGPYVCPLAADLGRASPLDRVLAEARGPTAPGRFLSLTPEERPLDFALAEPNSSMLRGAATAGGNSSFVLALYAELVGWTDGGTGVDLRAAGRSLDLLAVRRLMLADQALFPEPRVSVAGVGLDETDLGIRLARAGREAVELELPGLRATSLAVDAAWPPGETRPGAATPRVRATLWTTAGERLAAVLAPGAPFAWGPARTLARLRLEAAEASGLVRIEHVTLRDAASGHSLALGAQDAGALALLRPVPHRLEIEFPPAEGSALVIVSAISGPTTLEQGQAMARVSARTTEGTELVGVMRAGVDTAEWAFERADVRPRIRHRMAEVAESFASEGFRGHRYRGRIELHGRVRIDRLVIEHVGPDSSLYVSRVDLVDEAGKGRTRLPLEDVELQAASTTPPAETRAFSLPLPPLPCTALRLVTALHDATSVHQGQPVARVTVRAEDGSDVVAVLRAGVETSEWAWERPDVQARVRHRLAEIAESFPVAGASYQGHRYAWRLDLGGRRRVVELRVESLAPMAGVEVGRIAFEDTGGARTEPWSLPIPALPAVLVREQTQPRVELDTPSLPATEVAVASRLSRSQGVAQGATVALVRAWTTDGRLIEKPMRAGVDTSEWLADRPDVRARLSHAPAPVAFSAALGTEPGSWFLARVPLDGRVRLGRLAVEAVDPEAVLSVARISLRDEATGISRPVSALRTLVSGDPRWRTLCAALGETIYENGDALPRAWLVPRVMPASEPDALTAVRSGRLPDGAPFEPRRVALVAGGTETDFGPLDPRAEADVWTRSAGGSRVRTRSRTPAFLVLSEADYPGWRATIDGQPAAIRRVDHALRGLAVPAGDHDVELRYRPRSFQVGMTLTLLALIVLAVAGRRAAWPSLSVVALLPAIWMAVAAAGPRDPDPPRAEPAGQPAPERDDVVELAALPDGAKALAAGFGPAESWSMGRAGRWTEGDAVLHIARPHGESGLAVDMTLDRPSGETAGRIEVRGRTLRSFRAPNGRRREVVDLSGIPAGDVEMRVVTEDPIAVPGAGTGRARGVFLHSVSLLPFALAAEVEPGSVEDARPELVSGWWGAEARPGGPGGRWTGPLAVLDLVRAADEDGLFLDVTFDHPTGVTTGRIEVAGGPARFIRARNGRETLALDIGAVAGRTIAVRLLADRPFVPRQYDPSAGDGRALGFFVHTARLGRKAPCP